MHIAKRLILISAVLILAACSKTFYSDVTSFHTVPVPTSGKVSIVPIDESKLDSIEFQQYAAILAGNLQTAGYSQAGEGKPDLIVGFDVTINDGREKIGTRPGFRSAAYWDHYWSWGRYWGPAYPFDRYDFHSELVASTVYFTTLSIEIRKPDGEKLYEARAEAEVRSRALPEVVPLLAEALFKNFPGTNGKTTRIKIDLNTEK